MCGMAKFPPRNPSAGKPARTAPWVYMNGRIAFTPARCWRSSSNLPTSCFANGAGLVAMEIVAALRVDGSDIAASAKAERGDNTAVTPMAVAVFNASRRVMGWAIIMDSSLIAFRNQWIAATDASTLPRVPQNHKTVRLEQRSEE